MGVAVSRTLTERGERDLSGKYALLSTHFYYFGDKPVELPEDLHGIIKAGQWHLRIHAPEVVARFVEWIERLNIAPNSLLGKPQCRDLEKLCLLEASNQRALASSRRRPTTSG